MHDTIFTRIYRPCFAQASKKEEPKPVQVGSGADLAETLPFVPEVPDSHPRSDLASPVRNHPPEFGSADPFVAVLTKQKGNGTKEGAEEESPTDDELVEPIVTHETVEQEAERQFYDEQHAHEAQSKAAEQKASAAPPVTASVTAKPAPTPNVAVQQPETNPDGGASMEPKDSTSSEGIQEKRQAPLDGMHLAKKQKVETSSMPASETVETEGQPKGCDKVADQPADSQPVESQPPSSPAAGPIHALDSDEEEEKKQKQKGTTAAPRGTFKDSRCRCWFDPEVSTSNNN